MDIAAWLGRLGLGAYAESFADNDIDAEALATLDADDLKELGVTSLGHRKKLLAAIAQLREETGAGAVAAAVPNAPAPAVPSQAAATGERRQVTVLFADITGYTKLSNAIDAEELSGIVATIFAEVDAIVEDHGGTIDTNDGASSLRIVSRTRYPSPSTQPIQRGSVIGSSSHISCRKMPMKKERKVIRSTAEGKA